MSTSSALASAKRRRANLNQQGAPGGSNLPNNSIPETDVESEQKPKFTPIQLLQLHEIRLKKLETMLNENVEKNISNENINDNSNKNLTSYVDKSIATVKDNLEKLIDLKMSNKEVKLNQDDIEKIVETKLINNASKMNDSNIENMISLKIKNVTDKLDELKNDVKELDVFKNMLIKNQSDIIDNTKTINEVSMKINDIFLNTINNIDNMGNMDNMENDNHENNEDELNNMNMLANLFKQMSGGGNDSLEKFMNSQTNTFNSINIENDNVDVLDSVINIENNDIKNSNNETNVSDSTVSELKNISDSINKIDISDDDENEDNIKLFEDISKKIKDEIIEKTQQHIDDKNNNKDKNETHEIANDDAVAVVV